MKQNFPCRCRDNAFFSDASVDDQLEQLKKKGSPPDSWNEIYECPHCLSVWELSFDGVGGQCCGIEKLLRKISDGKENASEQM